MYEYQKVAVIITLFFFKKKDMCNMGFINFYKGQRLSWGEYQVYKCTSRRHPSTGRKQGCGNA